MWVRMTAIASRPSVTYDVGQVVEVDETTGQAWIDNGHAESVPTPENRGVGNLTTIAGPIKESASPQAVTPASMEGITPGCTLAIDTAHPELEEIVKVTGVTRTAFTAVFKKSHGKSIGIASIVPPDSPRGSAASHSHDE